MYIKPVFTHHITWKAKFTSEGFSFLGCNTVQFEEIPTFQKNISLPSSGSKRSQAAGSFSLTLKMEEICSSKCQLLSELRGITTQMTVPFTVTAVRTSDPTEVTPHVVPVNW
jgi:hypothetical protein